MKFTLKDYQADAVEEILANLKKAREIFKQPEKSESSSFSLAATTGAGKTVMAAAAIEALFWGSETFNFDPDPGAVVLWFSDDPSLNMQTFNRLRQASEKFTYTNLVHIEPPFATPRLEPGKVYFLNTQKLSKNSLLTRGHVEREEDDQISLANLAAPDMQGWTIWETLANTIDDKNLTLYLILDEAHRGFNTRTISDKPTIVRKLVDGSPSRPPIPIVWGISATIAHFENAMSEAAASKERFALPAVKVDPSRVQESGLVKDTLVLDIPNEAGNFDSVLVRYAAEKLKKSSLRWKEYSTSQGLAETVQPLLILQTPNTPDPEDVGMALDTIFDEYRDLKSESIRHVLGDHKKQKFGRWEVDWIEPQRVQDESHVRVIIAKDAISTGWDCPRAEVLVSFRPASDHTHITQLLGRMVRNPLARRIPGDERLNAVDCILPFFDRTTAVRVVKYLTGSLDEIPGAEKKTVLDGKDLQVNPKIPDSVWKVWESLPTETLPQRGAKPVKRLVALAQALSTDEVLPGAVEMASKKIHGVIDTFVDKNISKDGKSDIFDAAIRDVWNVEVQTIEGKFGGGKLSYDDFVRRADDRAIRSGFEAAKKAFGGDIAQSYVNYKAGSDDSSGDDNLRDAFVVAAAVASIRDVRDAVDFDSLKLTDKLFADHRASIKKLSDIRQQEYEDIRAMTTTPQVGSLSRPRTRVEGFSVEKDDKIMPSELVDLHLMADSDGQFPLSSLNNWERKIVLTELSYSNVKAWYRNPSRAAVDSLGVAYRDDDTANWRSMHPDFVFFHEVEGKIVASILDPHGHHLDDALMKLKALASYSEKFGDVFHRIEALAEVDDQMRTLNMKDKSVRDAIMASKKSALEFYQSDLAADYEIFEG